MKHLMKTIFGLSIVALLTVFISCPNAAGPNDGGGITPASVPQTPVEKALDELTVSPLKVFSATTKVNLPTATSVSGVTISWAAAPTDWIDLTDGNLGNIKQRPESGEQNVTLTATAKKNGETKTKDFTITIYPVSAAPSAQGLADSLSTPSAVSHDIDLPASVSGYPEAEITWTSADNKIIEIKDVSGKKTGIITYDLIDKTVTLTAKVSYKGQTAEKTFNVTVKRVEKITQEHPGSTSTYEFTGREYIGTSTDKATGKIKTGTKYTYTDVQTAADGTKTALFTQTARYNIDKKRWITVREEFEEQMGLMQQALAVVRELKTKNQLTLRDFIPLINSFAPGSVPNDIGEGDIFTILQDPPLVLSGTYDEFKALTSEQKTAKLKESISSFEEMLNQQLAFTTPENIYPPTRYIYRFEKSGDPGNEKIDFRMNAPYDPAKSWYEQRGGYGFRNSESSVPAGKIKQMSLSVWQPGPNQYQAEIEISISDGANASQSYKGNADYTPNAAEIAATLERNGGFPGPGIDVTISNINVSPDGKMTAKVKAGMDETFKSLTLQFEGEPLR